LNNHSKLAYGRIFTEIPKNVDGKESIDILKAAYLLPWADRILL